MKRPPVPRLSPLKTLAYSLLTIVLGFALLEGVLWLAGTQSLAEERDASHGFSGQRIFEPDPARGVFATAPRALRHSFNRQEFALEKPGNGLRVFTLGGSSAYGFPWGGEVAFPALLGRALAASFPDRKVESVNAAGMSYGSVRLRAMAREIARHRPDVVVLYEGHNEFVEQSLQRRVEEASPGPPGLLARWRLYAALTRLLERFRPEPAPAEGTKSVGELLGIDVVRETSRYVGDERKAEAAARFRENYAAILEEARRAGAAVLLCTVPANLAGWPPNQSVFAESVPAKARRQVEAALAEAMNLLAAGDAPGAAALLTPALALAPTHAETSFRLGQACQALGRTEEARAAFERAREHDAMPTRVTAAINEAIRSLAGSPGVTLVDVENLFERESPQGLVGFDLLEDYVHPNPKGHRLIARELWRTILESGLGGERRTADLAAFEAAVGPLPEATAESRSSPQHLYNLGIVLERQGLLEEAAQRFRECLERDPTYVAAAYNLGRLLHRAGRFDEAERAHRQALRYDPAHVLSMVGLGEALRAMGRIGEARQVLEAATRRNPDSAYAWNGLGATLAGEERPAEAEAAFRRALALEPERPDIRANLGHALLAQGKLAESEAAFRAALRARPDHVPTRNGLATALAEGGRTGEARALFEETLRIAPGDRYAAEGLARLRGR